MTNRSGQSHRGFTLIELMVVMAVIAALSATAIPAFIQYMKRSRTVEAVMSLRKISDGVVSYFTANERFPPSSLGFQPAATHAAACAGSSGLFTDADVSDFATDTWRALLFQPEAPFRYRYQFDVITPADPGNAAVLAEAAAYAMGDLDCDGLPSIWRVYLREIVSGEPLNRTAPAIWIGSETE